MKFNVIHIFAYGEAQIISDTVKYKADKSKFMNLQPVVDNIRGKKPMGVNSEDYHVINIFGIRADYVCKNKEACFSIKYDNIDSKKLNALVDEFEALYNADPQKR
jgi:hypothetical protein